MEERTSNFSLEKSCNGLSVPYINLNPRIRISCRIYSQRCTILRLWNLVLEPNNSLIEEFNNKRPFEDSKIRILHLSTCEELYTNEFFVNFLLRKPAVIRHKTSREFFCLQ